MSTGKPVVVVTGCSTGIGLELCLCLARNNFVVVATLRNPSSAPSSLCKSACDIQPLDVTSDSSASTLTEYLCSTYGRCDVLINNAGWGMPGTIETVIIEDAKRVFDVNVWGVVRMCQALIPLMRNRGGGLVLTVSSTSALRGLPCSDVYSGSKYAIEGMMESFRYSVQKDNIKVCMVNPGPTKTSFSKRFQHEFEKGTRPAAEVPTSSHMLVQGYIEKLGKRNSSGQSAGDCAEAIAAVIDRELPKNISDGVERVTFWNPTSEYGDYVLQNVKRFGHGFGGPLYEPLFKESYECLELIGKDAKK